MTADSPDDRIRALQDEVRRLTLMLESAPDFITRITVVWELGKRLRQRWPGLRVLYNSGYTEDVAGPGAASEPGVAFLQKPFLPVDLLASMRKLLDAKS